MSSTDASTHEQLVETMTGGMVHGTPRKFMGTDLLREGGRPRPEFRASLREIANLRNALTVASVVAAPLLIVIAVATRTTWWSIAVGFMLMGMVQTRMYILHHEAAHRLLFSNRTINDIVGVNILGWLPLGTGTHHYRRVHANHHRDEFGQNEPDFLLYAFYPISQASMRRKLRRDATGVSAYRMLKPRFTGLRNREFRMLSLRFFAGQVLVLIVFFLLRAPLLYPVLWVLPYITWYQVQNRLRAIAEHGGMTRSDDRRQTTHLVAQHPIARVLIAPYSVGYHLAHHVDSGVPFRNLPVLHRALQDGGYFEDVYLWPSYTELWKALIRSRDEAPS